MNYTARCRREGRWWVVEVPELAHTTQARRLDKVEEMVRSLVQMFTDDDPSSATVTVDVAFADDNTRVEVELARDSRKRAAAAQHEATERLTQAVQLLSAQGFSVRDIGVLLGLSYQRAQQLTR
jgi:DNA-directed RNA polymerase specialized sigma24 family protein